MLAAIHQLHYLPWLRYMEKIARADVFIVLDDVQYTKNGFQNRNKIKHADGWMYLTVPVAYHPAQAIREVEIAPVKGWAESHWRAIQTNYSRAPHFEEHADALRAMYEQTWTHLDPLSWELLTYLCGAMGIGTPLVRSSQLQVEGTATERLIALCRAVGADQYYSGKHAADTYLEIEAMEQAGIQVVLQDWTCPTYRQCFPRAGFIPDLSALDLVLNEGPASLQVLRAGAEVVAAP